ncbi:MAG TPA: hypothetical protein VFC29_01040, partial [Candidatus Limnocylindrales bacterium]|nr:hypothetical protein [Candidatus Limnocylindrales bacterium]
SAPRADMMRMASPLIAHTVFVIVLTVIQPLDGDRVFENISRHFEGDAMIGFVLCCLNGVPFEFWLVYVYTDYQ